MTSHFALKNMDFFSPPIILEIVILVGALFLPSRQSFCGNHIAGFFSWWTDNFSCGHARLWVGSADNIVSSDRFSVRPAPKIILVCGLVVAGSRTVTHLISVYPTKRLHGAAPDHLRIENNRGKVESQTSRRVCAHKTNSSDGQMARAHSTQA